jgi:hypothetical protein
MAGHALKNAEQVFNELVKNPDDVTVTGLEAAEIWRLFRKYPINPASLERLEYRAFLQAALIAAIDGSAAKAWIQSIFMSAMKPNASVKSIIKKIVKDALKRYYRTQIKGENPPIYESVVVDIAWQCKFYFDSINQGGDI